MADEFELRHVLDAFPLAAYTCDADGLITHFNEPALRLWGREPKLHDPTDRFCGSFRLYASDGARIRHEECWMARALQDDLAYQGKEILIERPDGSRVSALAYARPIHDEDDQLIGAVNVLVDVSEQKKIEDALRNSEEALRSADRRKDEFLAMLAHELRNPLAPLRNSLSVLRMSGADPVEARLLQIMERQLDQMVRLVDDLLEVSRISWGKIELRRERVTLSAVLRAALETSRTLLQETSQRLELSLPEEELVLDADAARLAQVFANLIDNAAKYTEPPGTIRLSARRDGGEVLVAVRDDGVGIPTDQLSEVFELFAQVDQSRGLARGGLGIGLTLVRRLLQLHGGHVEAHSDGPGTGSEFRVTLPLASALPHESGADSAASTPISKAAARRVLVVDDNQDAAESLGMLLRVLGAECHVAYDGATALQALAEFRPQMVLLDIGMPGMDGYQVARCVRERTDRAPLVIALTGWGSPDDRRRSREAGFDQHLVKPVDLGALKSLLALMDARRSG